MRMRLVIYTLFSHMRGDNGLNEVSCSSIAELRPYLLGSFL